MITNMVDAKRRHILQVCFRDRVLRLGTQPVTEHPHAHDAIALQQWMDAIIRHHAYFTEMSAQEKAEKAVEQEHTVSEDSASDYEDVEDDEDDEDDEEEEYEEEEAYVEEEEYEEEELAEEEYEEEAEEEAVDITYQAAGAAATTAALTEKKGKGGAIKLNVTVAGQTFDFDTESGSTIGKLRRKIDHLVKEQYGISIYVTNIIAEKEVSEAKVLMSFKTLTQAGLTTGSKISATHFEKAKTVNKKKHRKIKATKKEDGTKVIAYPAQAPSVAKVEAPKLPQPTSSHLPAPKAATPPPPVSPGRVNLDLAKPSPREEAPKPEPTKSSIPQLQLKTLKTLPPKEEEEEEEEESEYESEYEEEEEEEEEEEIMGKPVFNVQMEEEEGLPVKPVAFEGWLWKKGKGTSVLGRRNWNKRHFRLFGGYASYAKEERAPHIHSMPIYDPHAPLLSQSTDTFGTPRAPSRVRQVPCAFTKRDPSLSDNILEVSFSERIVKLRADKNAVLDKWQKGFELHMEYYNNPQVHRDLMSRH